MAHYKSKHYINVFYIGTGTGLVLQWELCMCLRHLTKWTNPFLSSSCLLCPAEV